MKRKPPKQQQRAQEQVERGADVVVETENFEESKQNKKLRNENHSTESDAPDEHTLSTAQLTEQLRTDNEMRASVIRDAEKLRALLQQQRAQLDRERTQFERECVRMQLEQVRSAHRMREAARRLESERYATLDAASASSLQTILPADVESVPTRPQSAEDRVSASATSSASAASSTSSRGTPLRLVSGGERTTRLELMDTTRNGYARVNECAFEKVSL
jgi:hypothetical protein